MTTHETAGIVISCTPYGDFDLILKLIVEGVGKISVFARAAKKSSKRFGGKIDLFDRGLFSTKSGKGSMLFLETFSLSAPYAHIRENLAAISAANVLAECYDLLIQEESEHPSAFECLDSALRTLDSLSKSDSKSSAPVLYNNLKQLLYNEGFSEATGAEFSSQEFSRLMQSIELLAERPLKTRSVLPLILAAA